MFHLIIQYILGYDNISRPPPTPRASPKIRGSRPPILGLTPMFGGPLREIENVSTCTFTCYSLSRPTHCPFISNPQFSPITLSPIQTPRFETSCTVYNRGLGPIGDLGLSGVLLSGKR